MKHAVKVILEEILLRTRYTRYTSLLLDKIVVWTER